VHNNANANNSDNDNVDANDNDSDKATTTTKVMTAIDPAETSITTTAREIAAVVVVQLSLPLFLSLCSKGFFLISNNMSNKSL